MKIVAIGELLWDVIDGAEHIGGAPFNFAANAKRLGHEVIFLTAVGADDRGQRARAIAAEFGLPAVYIQTAPGLPTGIVTVELDAALQPHFTIHRPAAYDGLRLEDAGLQDLCSFQADWIYFGTLHQALPQGREVTAALLAACRSARRFYDVNLRRDSFTPALVLELMSGADAIKLNQDEMHAVLQMHGAGELSIEEFCRRYSQRYGWEAVCVTLAEKGCAVLAGQDYCEAPACPAELVDAVGAGDAFAAGFIHGLGSGWPASRIAEFANRMASLALGHTGAL